MSGPHVRPSPEARGPRSLGYDAWRAVWLPISRSPRFFPLLVAVQRRALSPCNGAHALVIEGFPRSGNTFATQAFLSVNPDVPVSHHMHTPANVLRALELGVPAIVVVRRPADAVLSEVVREPRKSVRRALLEWLSFYETLRPHLDRIVVAPFEIVTTSYDKTIATVNARFGTHFVAYGNSASADAAVLDGIDQRARQRGKSGEVLETQVPRPSLDRAERKARLESELDAPRVASLLARANAVHSEYLDAAR